MYRKSPMITVFSSVKTTNRCHFSQKICNLTQKIVCLFFRTPGIVIVADRRARGTHRPPPHTASKRHKMEEEIAMARPKRKSTALETAEHRLSGMKLIDQKLNLGGGCTTQALDSKIKALRKVLTEYNTELSTLDALGNAVERAEQDLKYLSNKVLPGIATHYDKESDQYEMVGGVKPSDRKRTKRQPVSALAG